MAAKSRLTAYLMLVFLASYESSRGKAPRWITRPKPEYEVQVGRRVRIKCIFTGMDDPPENRTLVAWKKVGEGWIHRKSRYKINKKGLRISNAQPEDSGRFMCVAHNRNGFQNATANLIVKGKPTLSERSSTKSVSSDKARLPIQPLNSTPRPKLWRGRPGRSPEFKESPSVHRREIIQVSGKSVRLKCRASGRPNPKITWRRNDKKLSRSQQQHLTGKGWILAFDHLLMDDAGKYTCRVRNSFGTISRIFHVSVKPNDVPKGLTIQKGVLNNVTATEGDNATFVCKATGANQPVHVSWLKLNWNFSASKSKNDSAGEYQLITHTNHTLRQKLLTDKPVALPGTRKLSFTNRLVLLHVTKEDEGRYTCMVGNKAGFKSVHAFLTVKPKPGTVVVESRKHYPEIKGEVPMAAFIGVPLAVAAVLIASIVWCFTQTRKSRGKSSSEATAPTSDNKLALEMRRVLHERSNEYTPPPDEQLQLRNCNGHAILHCNNRASSHCDGHNCDSHAVSQFNGYDSPKRDSQSSYQCTNRDSDHQQPVEHMSRKAVSCGESEMSHNIYMLPSEGTGTNRSSVEIQAKNTFRPHPCSCKTNTGSSESSLSNSETRQSVI